MNVSEMVRSPRKSIVFRQYVRDLRDRDAAQYRRDRNYLAASPDSNIFDQRQAGAWALPYLPGGQATVLNGRGNLGLFQSVEARAQARGVVLSPRVTAMVRKPQAGAVPLADLVEAIRSLEVSQ
jgi:hypothetical protein